MARAVEAILIDDTFVRTGRSSGTSPLITVNALSTGFVKFDLSTLPDDTLPQQIKKATLKLYASNVVKDGSLAIKVQTSNWDETTVPFPPNSAIVEQKPVTRQKKKKFITFDVTSTVQGWLVNPDGNFGLALTSGDSSLNASFDSKENLAAGHQPELVLTIAPPQVVVVAHKPADQNLLANSFTTVVNWSEEIDSTESFNPATGVFTAPVSGTYQFNTHFWMIADPQFNGEAYQVFATKNPGANNFRRFLGGHRVDVTKQEAAPFMGNGILNLETGDIVVIDLQVEGSPRVIGKGYGGNMVTIVRIGD